MRLDEPSPAFMHQCIVDALPAIHVHFQILERPLVYFDLSVRKTQ